MAVIDGRRKGAAAERARQLRAALCCRRLLHPALCPAADALRRAGRRGEACTAWRRKQSGRGGRVPRRRQQKSSSSSARSCGAPRNGSGASTRPGKPHPRGAAPPGRLRRCRSWPPWLGRGRRQSTYSAAAVRPPAAAAAAPPRRGLYCCFSGTTSMLSGRARQLREALRRAAGLGARPEVAQRAGVEHNMERLSTGHDWDRNSGKRLLRRRGNMK